MEKVTRHQLRKNRPRPEQSIDAVILSLTKKGWISMVNILIVEDQWLLSSAVEEAVLSLGHEAIGTATTAKEAYELADKAQVAFVDVNLIDGATGPEIGRRLAADGVTVVFMTGNPEQLGSGVDGALGVISKPVMDLELVETIQFATDHHAGRDCIAPKRFIAFH
ncbi:response regulator [Agrobacterium genomosp. 3]|nr:MULTISPECIES: response regulator [Agrobacterium]MCA1869714.1 response regulator [Agrobacterium tomkonis]MCA1895290.1 response regulator [Agrobacterium tomkonis]QCL92576.1 response regulator [Agrobacterium tumefaciens]